MLRKAVLLFVVAVAGWCRLSAYDPVDTVWTFYYPYGIEYFDLSPDEKYVITATQNSSGSEPFQPRLYDAESGEFIRELTGWGATVYETIKFTKDSLHAMTAYNGFAFAEFNVEDGLLSREFTINNLIYSGNEYCFSPSGDTLAYLCFKIQENPDDPSVLLYLLNYKTGNSLDSLELFLDEDGYLPTRMIYSPAGDQIILYGFTLSKNYYIVNLDSNYKMVKMTLQNADMVSQISGVDYSPDGSKIAVCGDHGIIDIINSNDRSLIKKLDMSGDGYHYYCDNVKFTHRDNYILFNYIYFNPEEEDTSGGFWIFNYSDSTEFKIINTCVSEDCIISDDDQFVYTNMGGILKFRIDWTPQSYYDPGAGKGEKSKTVVKPNPVSGKAALSLSNLTPEACEIELYDTQGRLVRKLFSGTPEGETMDLEFDTGGLTAGSYLCTVVSKSGKKTVKFIIEE